MLDLTGRLLAGRYELLSVLGEGGFASVWKARQLNPEGYVAVKILNADHARDPKIVRSFLQEAQLYVPFRDEPNIATVLESGHDAQNDLYFLVMTLLEETVGSLIERLGPLPVERVLRLASDVGHALETVHAAGLVHRDVKCSNIMTAPGRERFVLTDFGIGVMQGMADKTVTPSELSKVGSWAYSAPETIRAKSREEVRPAADFYSLGVVLFRASTGQYPFPPQFPQVIQHHLESTPLDPRMVRPELPLSLSQLISRLLEKDPVRRFSNGHEFVQAVERVRQELERAGLRESAPVAKPKAKLPLGALLGVGGALVVLAVGVIGYALYAASRVDLQLASTPSSARFKLYEGAAAKRFGAPMQEGTTPANLKLKKQTYTVVFEKSGFFAKETPLDLSQGEGPKRPIELEPAYRLAVTTEPDGANVRVSRFEGEEKRAIADEMSNCTFLELHAGLHELVIEKEGYRTLVETVTVDDRLPEVSRVLLPATAAGLDLYTIPSGAEVWIDGGKVDQRTNCRIPELSSGKHRIRFRLSGYAERETTVVLDPRQGDLSVRLALESSGGRVKPAPDPRVLPAVAEYRISVKGTFAYVHVDRSSRAINESGAPAPWRIRLEAGTHTFRVMNVKAQPPIDVEITHTIRPDKPARTLILDPERKKVIEQ